MLKQNKKSKLHGVWNNVRRLIWDYGAHFISILVVYHLFLLPCGGVAYKIKFITACISLIGCPAKNSSRHLLDILTLAWAANARRYRSDQGPWARRLSADGLTQSSERIVLCIYALTATVLLGKYKWTALRQWAESETRVVIKRWKRETVLTCST